MNLNNFNLDNSFSLSSMNIDLNGTLIKKVRSNDNIIVSIYSQGKRKYTIIDDSGEIIKNDKVSAAYEDNTLILEDLSKYALKKGKESYYYKIIQDPYLEIIEREYGNGIKSPYFLNNGCRLSIEWIGDIPNPDFSIGTYSIIEDIPNNASKRWINEQNIICKEDNATNADLLPKSTWKDINDKRDIAVVRKKIVNLYIPDGINNKNVYFIWTESGLDYTTTKLEEKYFINSTTDIDIIKEVIADYKRKVNTIHNISDYKLELCSPNTKSCFLIEYKSPLKSPINTDDASTTLGLEENTNTSKEDPTSPKLIIEGLGDIIKVKVNKNLDPFVVWAGEPIINEDYSELSSEYIESGFIGEEEKAIEFKVTAYKIPTEEEMAENSASSVYYTSSGSSVAGSTAKTAGSGFTQKHLDNIAKGYDPLGQYKIKDIKAGVYFAAQNINQWFLFAKAPDWIKRLNLINPVKADGSMYQYAGHGGIDYNSSPALLNKQQVKAIYDGTVLQAGAIGGGGGYGVLIQHKIGANIFHSYYMHLKNSFPVKVGQQVKKGTIIGYVGNTGSASGLRSTHLHFVIYGADRNTQTYDPVAVYGPDKINKV